MTRTPGFAVLAVALAAGAAAPALQAWGGQGHRLVGLVAANHLTPAAKQNVAWLLGGQTLADVAGWADSIVGDQQQTGWWHYLNIPPDAAGYDRTRDCPRQPGVAEGSRADTWRDCVVDRIAYHEQRAADLKLDRADRAVALKFVVHFIGDLHQPFHALGVGRGGNDVLVRVFGSANCSNDPAKPVPCNLHSVWDSRLIARRGLSDAAYLAVLEKLIAAKGWAHASARASAGQAWPGAPADWAVESWKLAMAALVANGADIGEKYYQAQIPVIDERLAQAGVRLAASLNRIFIAPPPQ